MPPKRPSNTEMSTGYETLLSSVSELLRRGRQNAAKSVNAVLTTTYWLVGRRLVEFEQRGKVRAVYGSELLKRLSGDLQSRLGRGFSERNLEQMRQFYLQWGNPQTQSADSAAGIYPKISQTPSAKLSLGDVPLFSLSWSHYVRLQISPLSRCVLRFAIFHIPQISDFIHTIPVESSNWCLAERFCRLWSTSLCEDRQRSFRT